jgi:Lrp/AsnC family transcriptional regulator for asnA, asnC and gidA
MKPRVDDTDRSILSCLIEDARMPSAEIARRVGDVPVRTVRSRLKKLIDSGVVYICAGAVPEALGFGIRADVVIDVEPGKMIDVAERLCQLDQVCYVALSTGDFDISAAFVAPDIEAFRTFVTETIHDIPGISRTRVNVITKVFKRSCDWPFPDQLPW